MAQSLKIAPPSPEFLRGELLPPEPKQARSRARRRLILDAAMVEFAARGYQAASVGAITSRAQTASGAFYLYFRSKRQLLLVLMNELVAGLARLDLRPQLGAGGVRAGLRRFVTAALRSDRRYYGVIRAWQEAALTDPALARLQRDLFAWTDARILSVFQALQQLPAARPQPDLPAFARMMDRHFWSILARGAQVTDKEFDREVSIASDVIYFYLFHDSL